MKKGDKVSKFDLRFLQPNEQSMPTASIHALEHLLAPTYANISAGDRFLPMGCRTGFYLTVWGTRTTAEIKTALEKALAQVLEAEEVPAANAVQCGNYRDLSLFGAKEYAREALQRGFSLEIYG